MVLFNKRTNFILNTGQLRKDNDVFVVKTAELFHNLFSSKSNYSSY